MTDNDTELCGACSGTGENFLGRRCAQCRGTGEFTQTEQDWFDAWVDRELDKQEARES